MRFCQLWSALVASLTVAIVVHAAGPAAFPDKDKWTTIDPPAVEIEVKAKDGTLSKQAGAISNIAIDRQTGSVLAFVNGAGLFRSGDQGKTWGKMLESKGACASTYSLLVDPLDGARIFCLLTGAPSALTLDGGKSWIEVKHNNWAGVVAWNDPEAKTLLARASGHETWKISTDQGKTWAGIAAKQVQWTFTVGLFDAKTIIGVNDAIYRSDDSGGTFAKVGEGKSRGYQICPMVAVKDHGYVLVGVAPPTPAGAPAPKQPPLTPALAVSLDKGATWNVLPTPKEIATPYIGPYIGKSEEHIILASVAAGFFESNDGGKTWAKVIGMPLAIHDIGGNMNHGDIGTCGYDPKNDTFYVCSRGNPVYKYQRKAAP